MSRVPAEKGDQQDGRARRPRGMPKGPGEKRDQEDGEGQKERETKRIANGTSRKERPGG